ncbi:hypothetical protein [Streptomyces sp. NPDC048442]|uniref:hypothetical protein n=1 Tax=Streptomyces sp. NPDC048442 TaxID=3154823 RepID=UPI00342E3163
MNPAPAAARKERPSTISALASAAALLAACALPACSAAPSNEDPTTRTVEGHWEKNAGSKEAAAAMKVEVPSGATGVKGAVRVNPQEDYYLLSFITAQKTAEEIAHDLNPDEALSRTAKGGSSNKLFGHLGLPAPESLNEVRWAGVCPPCRKDPIRKSKQWIDIYVAPLPNQQARIYLMAF